MVVNCCVVAGIEQPVRVLTPTHFSRLSVLFPQDRVSLHDSPGCPGISFVGEAVLNLQRSACLSLPSLKFLSLPGIKAPSLVLSFFFYLQN